MTRAAVLALTALLTLPATASAEWQIRPFLGITFGGNATATGLFSNLENAVDKPNVVFGITGALVGEVFGIEADIGHAPGFFQSGDGSLILSSSVTTLTGNITVGLPRHMVEYTLRPYFIGGAGWMRPRTADVFGAFDLTENLAAVDLGAGVTGFLTRRVGLSWDVRHFRSINGRTIPGVSVGPVEISFWRANMALAFRY
jgi:hypothetical protein